MKEEEEIATYFLRVDEILNSIVGLGATIEEKPVVQKIMRTLPSWFNSKVSVLEDIFDLDNLLKDVLYGVFIAYERGIMLGL